jgi:hypothetical protein
MNSVKRYFTIWWIPIAAYLLPITIFVVGTVIKGDNIIDGSLIGFYLNITGNVVASVVQIVLGKWYFIFPQLIISAVLVFFVSILFTFSPPDYYGANKRIPNDIHINIPIETEISKSHLLSNDFVLASISQPGIYSYYTTYNPKEKGAIYLKVYEVTSNDRLSEARITESSKIIIGNLNEKVHSGEFTIYEGSWGDKYAARIELWFKPQNGRAEYKLAEKIYLVEGWMR